MTQAAEKISPPHLEWIRPPLQARTRRTLGRMLDAAEKLVAEKGFAETSIVEIARVAGTSVGGFYRRFHDKQGLMQALHARFCEEARATADAGFDPARWVGTATDDVVRQFTAFIIDVHRERAGSIRAFMLASLTDETVRRRTIELSEQMRDRLAALLVERRHDLAHPDPERSAAFAVDFITGTLAHAVQFQREGGRILDDELPRLVLAYLGVRGA
jgi:AcrR family transcriptional regulator